MGFSEFSKKQDLEITGVSYAGRPVNGTTMYITKKVEHLLNNLAHTEGCLVFVEDTMEIPETLCEKNVFYRTATPQRDYAEYVQHMWEERRAREMTRKYTLTPGGYYVGENVEIGENSVIEPMCFIDHDVRIGKNALVKCGAKIRYAQIGDHFVAGENSTIGTFGFTMTKDAAGNTIRIPTMGGVLIGDHVEVGVSTNVECGSAGNTILEDHVKLDTMTVIGHDSHLHKNTELCSNVVLGGFCELGEDVFVGLQATLRNRIRIGAGARISMGAVVTQSVPEGRTVTGNFAIPHQRFMKNLKESIKE